MDTAFSSSTIFCPGLHIERYTEKLRSERREIRSERRELRSERRELKSEG
jgi:hypothetical protein